MRVLEVLPEVVGAIEFLIPITIANLVHRFDVRDQLVAVGFRLAVLARKLAAAQPAHIPHHAVVRLLVVGAQRVLEGLARPKVGLEVDRVDVPLGFGGGLEALLALCAGMGLLGFMEASWGVRRCVSQHGGTRETYVSSSAV